MASHSAKHTSAGFKKVRKNCRKQTTLKKRTIACYKCKANFRSEKSLSKHMKECIGSHKQESVICHICGKGYPDRADVEKHLQAHTQTPCCFCTMCKKTFAEFEDLESHISVCKVLRLRRKKVRKAFIRKHQIFKRLEQIEVLSENETSSENISPQDIVDVQNVTEENQNEHGNNTTNFNQLDKNNTINMNKHQLEENNSMDKTNTVSISDHNLYEKIDTKLEMDQKSHDIMDADLEFLCENCGLQFEGCLNLIEHYQVHSNPKLANQYDPRGVVEFDDSLFLSDEEVDKDSAMNLGPGCCVNDIMHVFNEVYNIPTVVTNTASSGTGLSQVHSGQGHVEMGGHQLVTENLWAKDDDMESFRSAQDKQQKAFEVSEVYALDSGYNECGGWKFTKIKADGKPKVKASEMAVTWNDDSGLTSLCDPKSQRDDPRGFHQVIPSSSVCGQAVTYPNIYGHTMSGPDDTIISDLKGLEQTIPDLTEYVSTIQQQVDHTVPSSQGYVASVADSNWYDSMLHDPAGYKNNSDSKGYDSMLDLTGYDNKIKGTTGIDDTNQDSNGNAMCIPLSSDSMLDTTGYDNVFKDTNTTDDLNQDTNGNVSIPHNKGYDSRLETTGHCHVGTDQTVDMNQDSDGYVVTIPDKKGSDNHDAEVEILITWNSDQSCAISQEDSMSNERLDADGIRLSDDTQSIGVCSHDIKPVQTFENVFEKFVSDRNSKHCSECTDTIFVCKYCREWFVTDPDLKNHLLLHCDNLCLSSAGEKLADSSLSSIGTEHVHLDLSIFGKSHVESGITRSSDTNVDPFQSSQFEEFWIHDSSTLDLTEQLELTVQENPTETDRVELVDTHLNTVGQITNGDSQVKGDHITYMDSLGNIKITCHQCGKVFHEDKLFCHDPCFSNKNKDMDDCRICHRKVSSYKSVLTHMRAHSELANPSKCAPSPRTYQRKGVIDDHCQVHPLEHTECHICGKLVSPAQLKHHVKLHDRDIGQERSLQCVVCEQSLPDMTSLASHQYSEHSMQDDSITDIISCYRCPHCKEEMQHKPLFIAHVASHTGVFPFECSLCLKGFFYKTLLNMHSNKCHSVL